VIVNKKESISSLSHTMLTNISLLKSLCGANWLTEVYLEKWPLKWCSCMLVFIF